MASGGLGIVELAVIGLVVLAVVAVLVAFAFRSPGPRS
jgi:hypothetical protein